MQVVEADDQEDIAVEQMTEEEAELMLQRLEEDHRQTTNGNEREMNLGKERLKKKLLRRQEEQKLKEIKKQRLEQSSDPNEKLAIQHNYDQNIMLLEEEAERNKQHYSLQFETDQQLQNEKIRKRLQKKHDKKMRKLIQSQNKIQQLVTHDDTSALVAGSGGGGKEELLELQHKIQRLDQQSQEGQDELDALMEANAADSRYVQTTTTPGTATATSILLF